MRTWSYILILCFAFLAIPKDYVHHHDHDHDGVEQEDHHKLSFEKDCFACDIYYADLTASFDIPLEISFPTFSHFTPIVPDWELFNRITVISDRGPPIA